MKRVFRRLRARGGESFAEILVALLIVALATLLLASMVGASGSIDMATRKEDDEFYEAVSAVEIKDTSKQKTTSVTDEIVTVQQVDASGGTVSSPIVFTGDNIEVYEDDGLSAYKKKG